jgi:hypothetical protein
MGKAQRVRYFLSQLPYHDRLMAKSLYERHLEPLRRAASMRILMTVFCLEVSALIVGMFIAGQVRGIAAIWTAFAATACAFALEAAYRARAAHLKEGLRLLYANWSQMVAPTRIDHERCQGRYGQRMFWAALAGLRRADRSVPENLEIQRLIERWR